MRREGIKRREVRRPQELLPQLLQVAVWGGPCNYQKPQGPLQKFQEAPTLTRCQADPPAISRPSLPASVWGVRETKLCPCGPLSLPGPTMTLLDLCLWRPGLAASSSNCQPDNPLETMSNAHTGVSVSCFLGSWGEVIWGPRTPCGGLWSRQWPQDGGQSRDLPV